MDWPDHRTVRRTGVFLALICALSRPGVVFGQETTTGDASGSASSDGWAESWLDDFEFFGLIRIRPELHSNYDFTSGTDDQADYVGQKVRFGFQKSFRSYYSLRVSVQDSRLWGGAPGSDSGASPANRDSNDSLDLNEAWIGWEGAGVFSARLGRQHLEFGDSRLVSASDWSNVGRSFDALRLSATTSFWRGDLWGAVLAEEDSDFGANSTGVGNSNPSGLAVSCNASGTSCTLSASTPREIDDAYFAGLHNSFFVGPHLQGDLYYLGVYRKYILNSTPTFTILGAEITSEDRSRQRDNLHTAGLRLTNRTQNGRAVIPFDWTAEAAWQTGTTGRERGASWDYLGQSVVLAGIDGVPLNNADGSQRTEAVYKEKEVYRAWAAAADIGLSFFERALRLGLEGAVGSGDPNRNDGSYATFTNLFANGHDHLGQADLISWRNVRAGSVNLTLRSEDWGMLRLAYWEFYKHRRQDAWYAVNGSALSGLSTESSANARYTTATASDGTVSTPVAQLGRMLYREYDILYVLSLDHVVLAAGYSFMLGGDALRNKIDGVYENPATRRPRFEPRADFAFLSFQYSF